MRSNRSALPALPVSIVLLLLIATCTSNYISPLNTDTLPRPGPETDASLLIADNVRQVVWLGSDRFGIQKLQVATNTSSMVILGSLPGSIRSSGVLLPTSGAIFFHLSETRQDDRRTKLMAILPASNIMTLISDCPRVVEAPLALSVIQGWVYFAGIARNTTTNLDEVYLKRTNGVITELLSEIPGAMSTNAVIPPSRFFEFGASIYFASFHAPSNATVLWRWSPGGPTVPMRLQSGSTITDPRALISVPARSKFYWLSVSTQAVNMMSCCSPGVQDHGIVDFILGDNYHFGRGDMVLSGQYLYWAISIGYLDWTFRTGTFDTALDLNTTIDPFTHQRPQRSSGYFLGKTTNYAWLIQEQDESTIFSSDSPSGTVLASYITDQPVSDRWVGERFYSSSLPFMWSVTSAFTLGSSLFFIGHERRGSYLMECTDASRNCTSISPLSTVGFPAVTSLWAQYDDSLLYFSAPTSQGLEIFRLEISGSSRFVAPTALKQRATVLEDNLQLLAQLTDRSVLYWGSQAGLYEYRVARISGNNDSFSSIPIDYQTAPVPPRTNLQLQPSSLGFSCSSDWCYIPSPLFGHFALHIATNTAYELGDESGQQIGLKTESPLFESFLHPGLNGIIFTGNVSGRLELFLFDDVTAASFVGGSSKIRCKPLGFASTYPLLPYPEYPAYPSLYGYSPRAVIVPSASPSFAPSERATLYLRAEDTFSVPADLRQYIYRIEVFANGTIVPNVLHNETATTAQISAISPLFDGKIFFYKMANSLWNLTAVDVNGTVVSDVELGGSMAGDVQFFITRSDSLLLNFFLASGDVKLVVAEDRAAVHSVNEVVFFESGVSVAELVGQFPTAGGGSRLVITIVSGSRFKVLSFDATAANWTSVTPITLLSTDTYGKPIVGDVTCRPITNFLGQTLLIISIDFERFITDTIQPAVKFYDSDLANALQKTSYFTHAASNSLFFSRETGFFAFSELGLFAVERFQSHLRWIDAAPCVSDANCPNPMKCQVFAGGAGRYCLDPSRLPAPGLVTPPITGATTPIPCSGPSPLPGAVCQIVSTGAPVVPGGEPQQTAVWVFNGALLVGAGAGSTVPTLNIPPATTLIVNGPLQISPPASPSTVTLTVASGSTIQVNGCVSFAGTLQVSLSPQQVASGTNVPVVSHQGYCNGTQTQFSGANINAAPPRDCARFEPPPAPQYSPRSLSIVLGVDESACSSGVAGINVPLVAGLAGGIGGAIIIVIIVAVVIWRKFLKKKDADEEADIENDKEIAASHATPMKDMKSDLNKKKSNAKNSAGESQYSAIAANPETALSPSAEATILTIPADKIKILHKLGEGSYGAVYLGLYEGQFVAVKKLLKSMLSAELDAFFREAGIMCALEPHPNLVKMSGLVVEKDSGEYSIVVQFCPGGSLDSYLSKSFSKLDEYAMFKLAYGICSGCESLAKQNVIHRDLACRNILLGERFFPLISDFGYSRRVDAFDRKGATNANIGPVPWMAPEQIRERSYSEKSDVWAFGATLVEILTGGAKPYASREAQLPSIADLALAIRDAGLTPLDCLDETVKQLNLPQPPAWILEVLPQLFAQDPANRPTFHQIKLKLKKIRPEFAVKYENEQDLANAILVNSDDVELENNLATREYGLLAPDQAKESMKTRKSTKSLKTAKSKRKSKFIDADPISTNGPKFKIICKLGEGSFGVVSLGKLDDGRFVAVKQVSGGSAESAAMYNEAKIMLSLKPDRNVIQVHGLTLEGDKLAIVMEFAAFGSMDTFVEKTLESKKGLPSQQLFRFAIGIARGMASLADQKVVHRDLAARNVLLDSNLEPKVSDFGLSRTVSDSANSGKTAATTGPIRWMDAGALSQTYNEKTDVWAYGCTLFELITGSMPYPDSELIDIAIQVRDKGLTPLSELSGKLAAKIDAAPEYIIALMKMCFAQDPEKRPSFAQIVDYLQSNAPASVLRVEDKRRKRKEKREKILQAMDDIAL